VVSPAQATCAGLLQTGNPPENRKRTGQVLTAGDVPRPCQNGQKTAVNSGRSRAPRTASDLGRCRLTRCVKQPSKQRVASQVNVNTALTAFRLARLIPYSSQVQQPVRPMAILSSYPHTSKLHRSTASRAAPVATDQKVGHSAMPEDQMRTVM
jgi:hypothetical protein